jgi:hypothetical protein
MKYPIEEIIKLMKEGNNITKSTQMACESNGIPYSDSARRVVSKQLELEGVTDNTRDAELEETDAFKEAKKRVLDKSKQRFIVSWAQSETDVHEQFLANMEAYAKHIDADISIIAGRYKNPTTVNTNKRTKDKESDLANTWHERVLPYLDAARHKIHPNLCILSDVKVQPTASTPLSGLNGLTGLESCIVGHPRVHLKSLPILDGYPHKLLVTTGSVTVDNYTDTKSGKKGEFHHTLGFVIAELDDDVFHLRQVTADDDGSFYDLMYHVSDGLVDDHTDMGALAIVFGDLHLGETNDDVLKVSFDMSESLNCQKIILHDVFNGHSISHHERNMPFTLMNREKDGSDDLLAELHDMVEFFDKYSEYYFVMVRSNHDEFLDRWLNDVDWRKMNNKYAYLKLANSLSDDTLGKGIIPLFLDEQHVDNVYCLGIDESYRIADIECGMHGHKGANGSRGGVMQFKNMNTKNITGHTHTPCREDGHSSVGTLTHLRVGYNVGMSSWVHSNIVIYPNGKHQHVHIINNKYTTL